MCKGSWREICVLLRGYILSRREEKNTIRKIERGEKIQENLIAERDKLGKFTMMSNLRRDPKEIYELYKFREDVEVAFDSMKN